MRLHAHKRHDRRDRVAQGLLIVFVGTVAGLTFAPATLVALVDTFGPYRGALVGAAIGAVLMTGAALWALRWTLR